MADKVKEKKENKVNVRRLFPHEVAAIVEEFAVDGVTADSEFLIVPLRKGKVFIHSWEEIPWSEDGGKTVKGIPIRDRIKQIIAGE